MTRQTSRNSFSVNKNVNIENAKKSEFQQKTDQQRYIIIWWPSSGQKKKLFDILIFKFLCSEVSEAKLDNSIKYSLTK